jgi:hypothetical protein
VSKIDTEDITRFEVPAGAHVLSVYLQTHSAESETVLRDQLKEIERRFEAESDKCEFDQCVKRIWDFLYRFEARAPMLIVLCTATGSLWARQIDILLPNAVRWDERPYWKPLIEAIDEFEPYGVLLFDGTEARLFGIAVGKIHEHRVLRREPNEKMDAYLPRVIRATEELIRSECPSRLVVAGDRELWTQFLRAAPGYLQKSIIAVTDLPIDASAQQVLAATSRYEQLAERRFEIRLVDELVRLASARKKVTLGIRATLDALNDNRVWRLVYSEDFAARGGHCVLCDSDYCSELELCKKCNVAVRPADDLVASMVSRALNADASIEEVRGEAAARLDQMGGIGAFLRF